MRREGGREEEERHNDGAIGEGGREEEETQ